MAKKQVKPKGLRIEFSGKVTMEEAPSLDFTNDRVHIGGVDVLDRMADDDADRRPVDIYLNGKLLASGVNYSTLGWGYSEFTPMESDSCIIGNSYDLIEELEKLVDKEITMVVVTQGEKP